MPDNPSTAESQKSRRRRFRFKWRRLIVAIAAMAGISIVSQWAAALAFDTGSPLVLFAVAIALCGIVVVVGYLIHRYS
jgi:hypothetical protein